MTEENFNAFSALHNYFEVYKGEPNIYTQK